MPGYIPYTVLFCLSKQTCNIEPLLGQESDYITLQREMASITMTASFLGNSSSALANRSPVATQRRLMVVANVARTEKVKVSYDKEKEDNNNGRRNIMFAAAAAAAAVCSISGIAVADEPKPGSPEAKKVYAPICVTMPTARVCRKGPPNRD